MIQKSTLKTKTFWAGLGSVLAGAATIATTGNVVAGVQMIVTGILAICGRDAITKVEPTTEPTTENAE